MMFEVEGLMEFLNQRNSSWVVTFEVMNFSIKNKEGYLNTYDRRFSEKENKVLRKFCLFGEE